MPVLILLGPPKLLDNMGKEQSDLVKVALEADLREAVASVKELGIKPGCVSVFTSQLQCPDSLCEELVVQVTGLYERPERTDEMLKKMCDAIVEVLKKFARAHLARCQYVEAYPITCREATTSHADPTSDSE